MDDITSLGQKGDHRPRVARARRDKMRERLTHAVMICCGRSGSGALPMVDDILAEADVVRSTFYRYFDSIEEAAASAARTLYSEMTESVSTMAKEADTPLARVTIGFHLILMRCVTDAQWGAFYSRNFHLITDTAARDAVGSILLEARDQGLMDFDELSAAIALLDGALIEGMTHIRRGCDRPRAYVEDIARLCLRGLGVPNEEARSLVREYAVFIRNTAPSRLPWWQDPWD